MLLFSFVLFCLVADQLMRARFVRVSLQYHNPNINIPLLLPSRLERKTEKQQFSPKMMALDAGDCERVDVCI